MILNDEQLLTTSVTSFADAKNKLKAVESFFEGETIPDGEVLKDKIKSILARQLEAFMDKKTPLGKEII
jgi:hypothetical protein